MGTLCRQQQPPAAAPQHGSPRRAGDGAALPASPLLLLLLLLLSSSISACNGAPMPSQALEADEDLQLWKEIDDACSAYLSTDSQPQMSSTLEELCFLVMGFLQKPQGLDEKDNTKRFLFHYSKTHDSGNSDIMISGCHIAYLRQTKLGPEKTFKDLEGFKAEATFSIGHAMGGDQWIFAKEAEPNVWFGFQDGFLYSCTSCTVACGLLTVCRVKISALQVAAIQNYIDGKGVYQSSESLKDPNEDTEWNDTLRQFGILPPKEKEKDEIEEMVLHLQKEAEVKPYERMNLEELKEAEDDFDEADRKAIEMYRQQRLKEWKCLQRMQKYGELREISGEQYVKEVTNAPEDVWVIIHLYRSSIPVCLLVNEHLSLLARKFPEVKFLKALVNSCIPNYQDRCLPTILVYKSGEIKSRFIGVSECGGMYLKVEELEWKLAEVGAVETDLEENPRKDIRNIMTLSVQNISAPEDTNTQRTDVMKPRIA